MPNIASVLKEEIARVARKELRAETEKLKKASAQYRSEIAALKRRVSALEALVSRLDKTLGKKAAVPVAPEELGRVRFSTNGFQTLRQRLGLTQTEMGVLIGVSAQTIYNWETGNSAPRQQQMAAIVAVRGLGKKEAATRLAELAG